LRQSDWQAGRKNYPFCRKKQEFQFLVIREREKERNNGKESEIGKARGRKGKQWRDLSSRT
jgi:hypothetical protein